MKATKITNVNHVTNPFLKKGLWKNTFTQFMKATKIINVNLVENHFLIHIISRTTSSQFMKATKIINVSIVKKHSAIQDMWKSTLQGSNVVKSVTKVIFAVIYLLQIETWTNTSRKTMAQYLSNKSIQKFIELEECLTFSKPTKLLRVAVIVYSEP